MRFLRSMLWAWLLASAAPLAGNPAAADEFASQGQTCGTPGHPMDMSRIYAALRQYPNGRLLFLTPAEEARLREQFRQANAAGQSPMQELAPCFGCTKDYAACIAYDGPTRAPGQPPEQFGSNGGNQPPEQFGSSGGSQPPARGDGDACRNNPQSYTCLFGHHDVVAVNPPACREAACDDRTLPGRGWHIARQLGGNDCVWGKGQELQEGYDQLAQGQADDQPYDPAAINRAWRYQWYPGWTNSMQQVFDRGRGLRSGLAAKGVRADWWFAVTVGPDGTIVAVEDKGSDYNPKGSRAYDRSRFRADTEAWRKALLGVRAPPFPAGSVLHHAVMSVNFNNVKTGFRDTPVIPQEPAMQDEKHGKAKLVGGC